MSDDNFGDLLKSTAGSSALDTQNALSYSSTAFEGYGSIDDGLDTHNPFADLKSTPDLSNLSLASPQEESQSISASTFFQSQADETPSLDGFNPPQLDSMTPMYFNQEDLPKFSNSEEGLQMPNGIEQDVGFDGKSMAISPENFVSFSSNNDSYFSAPVADQTPQGFSAGGFSPPAQEPFEDPSETRSIAPTQPDPRSIFHPSQSPVAEPPPPQPSTSAEQRPKKSPAPKSPTFKPFGVTATLTSSNDDDIDEFAPQNAAPATSSRPALPDILGGGSLGASVLIADSRSSLPAFKKSPRKTARGPSASVSSSASAEDPKSAPRAASSKAGDGPKPYRPLGLKIAQPKPIMTSPPAATTKNTSQNPASANKALRGQTTGVSSLPKVSSPSKALSSDQNGVSTTQEPSSVSPSSKPSSKNQRTPSILQSVKSPEDSKGPVTPSPSTSSTTDEGMPNHRVVVSPISPSTSEDQPTLKSSTDASTEAGHSTVVPGSPSSHPAAPSKPEAIEAENVTGQHKVANSHNPAPENVAPPSVVSTSRSPTRLQTESDDEDDRPLASVREGLVQQQNLAYKDPSTGLTPTPSSSNFGSKYPHLNSPIQPPMPRYKCSVGDPQKMGMINDIHTVYTVKTNATDPSNSGPLKGSSTVLRRFRDFVWLFDALTSNNPGVIVPPIPDKNIRNRFQEGFIAARRVALEIFLQKTVNHPMLMSDPDLKLFLESDSFTLEIKHRKPDSSSQHGWLANIAGPRFSETDEFFDQRKMALEVLEGQLKGLQSTLSTATKARRAFSQSLADLSQALLTLSTCDLSKPVRNALDRLAGLHRQFHTWSEEQSKDELEGLIATVEAYSRLITSARLTFSGRVKSWEKWQFSLNNLKKVQMNHEKAKRSAANEHSSGLVYSLAELESAERRAHEAHNEYGDVSKLIKAEMSRFDREKVEDFKAAICSYVDGLARRQRQVVGAWQEYYQLLQALSKHNSEPKAESRKSGTKTPGQENVQAADPPKSSQSQEADVIKPQAEPDPVPEFSEDTSAWASEPQQQKGEGSSPTVSQQA